MRTQVAIIGAGPAGLLLARLLHLAKIDSVILESRDRAYVEGRVRAGLLEQGSVDILKEAGVADRLMREGLVHHGIELRFGGRGHRIDFQDLVGKSVTVYGQNEIIKDMIDEREAAKLPLLFEAEAVSLEGTRPRVRFRHNGKDEVLEADYIAGCDGFHGVARASIPPRGLSTYDRIYPFAWLGILADAPPKAEELIYARHDDGFALATMRSPKVTRMYLQCEPDDGIGQWSEQRIWTELKRRLTGDDGYAPAEGKITQKGITAMRSFVCEPMQYGRLFLAGDAAHIVPPTGAKGMNLAFADIRVLARALEAHYGGRGDAELNDYSRTCLARVWQVQRFSWWMTQLLHKFDDSAFDARRQQAELEYVTTSRAAATSLAENYTGLPLP
jgi:p-hydroxybenzoate 3-monooxygenase